MTLFRSLGLVDYQQAWDLQRELHSQVKVGAEGTVLLLEHPPVYTAGKRTEPHERPQDGTPVVDVDRGGKITFHGPGQLVGYPIVKLPDHVYVVDYVRRLEQALIDAIADLGLTTARVPGRSGVWFGEVLAPDGTVLQEERKVAAIGIRVSEGVAMHGFSLNCDVDLDWYERFIPCGISDAGVTTLSAELGRRVSVEEITPIVQGHLDRLLAWQPFERTPDLPAKPEPGKSAPAAQTPAAVPSIPILSPTGASR